MNERPWYLYVLACRGGSLYTGVSTDVARRYAEHAAGRGARYTRSHPPEQLLAVVEFANQGEALRAEHSFKILRRAAKLAWCSRHASSAEVLQGLLDADLPPD